ncbi:alpha-L-arabinofuranosidase C-terminal domain-containing protein [Microbacterium sp.]|uniref:alpha-L-arabinofuranosidase C-terminal domain-containing protein n=1 Tax=Microbacterium sp. TaxID=51671 RepID=UPI0025CE1314|nr:alpha-L-arabinofuranosidase C-terminal domain-containing protein [Microbacterium sp.]
MLSRPHTDEAARGRTFRRAGSILATAAVLLSGVVPAVGAAAAPLPTPVASYDFAAATGTTVPDASGHGHDAAIRGTGFAVEGDVLSLPGGAAGSSAAYVEMPRGLFDGRSTVTVSAWLQDRTGAGNQAAMFFGTTENLPQQYWLLNPANPAGRVKSVLTDGPRIAQPWTLERGISPTDGSRGIPGPAATTDWALYTTVITPTSITAYLDDTKIGTVASTRTIADFGSDLVAYIGKSSYPDRVWKGGVRDVAIYDTALTDDDVKALVAQGTPSNQEDVDAAAAALAIPGADDVRGNVTLPTSGSNGTMVSWTSSDPSVVSATGEVTRPAHGAAAKTVEVTATVSKGSSSATRAFTLAVQPLPEEQELGAYFFPFFTGESTTTDEEISFATSRGNDPKSWLTLNEGKPVLTSDQGEEGIRDPFVLRSPDGDRFYMLSTDLNMFDRYNGDFGRAQEVGSRKLNVWQSDDLVTWSPLRQITVSSALAGNTWAPEATWDPERGEYVVYWASNLYPSASTDGRRASDSYNRMMMVTTRDFVTFSEPQPWVDVKRGAGKGTIDATVVRDGDVFYRFIKDEASMTVRQERSTDLTATVAGSLPTTTSTPGWQLVKEQIGVGQPNPWGGTFTNGEGPTVFADNAEAGHWYMLIDQPSYHGGQGYLMFETRDIASGTWTSVTDAELPSRPRHGTVLPITAAEQQRLIAAYPTDETADYSITADPAKEGAEISDEMYGVFFEDINNAADGGLYAELVRNRSFEFLPVDNRDFTGMTAWTPVGVGGSGTAKPVNDAARMNERNRTYLQLDLTSGGTGTYGVENGGFDTGIALTDGGLYDVSFWARTTAPAGTPVSVVLRSADGTPLSDPFTATVAGDGWVKYTGAVTATATTDRARLLVQAGGAGTLRLDEVSLFPRDTFMGRTNGLRKDIAQKIADLHPKFVRFPGGCIVNVNSHEDYSAESGYERARSYQWKDSVGPVETRATNANFWGYNQSLGLGYYEYFQFAEDIGAKPVPDVPALLNGCGQALQPTDPALLERHIQDTLDLIEFANGGVDTTWGKLRADMGHPAPFGLDRIEIGNEENYPEAFMANFVKFRDAITAEYPDMILISNSGPDAEGATFEKHWAQNRAEKVDMVDEHYYRDPSWFLSHNLRYDSYDRNGPDVWIGEYASRDNRFFNALSEAAFMTGLERNADVVQMASYAPLLADQSSTQWRPDLIWFDRDQVWGSANYEVQKLFMRNTGDRVVPTTAAGDLASTGLAGAVGLSTWSTSARYDDVKVTTPDGETLFADDFSDTNADGWTPLANAGSWSAADGSYVQSSTTANNTLVAGPALEATEYDLSLKATKLAGAEGFLVGFGVQGAADYLWWNLGGWGNTRSVVEKAVGGAKSILTDTGTPRVETGRTYDLRIQVRGPEVTLFVDGQQAGRFTNTAVEPFAQVMTKDDATGDVILKVVNAQAKEAATRVDLGGLEVLPTAQMTVLAAAPGAVNTADATPVAPETTDVAVSASFTRTFAPYSVTFLRMHTRTPDTEAPVVTVSTSPATPDGANGWFVSPVAVSATATDDTDGAPRVEVSTDGGTTWAAYTGALTPADGTATLAFRATDAAGNVSASVPAVIRVDRAAPTVVSGVDATARTVRLTATDTSSGVDRIEYRIGDAGSWATAAGAEAVVTVPAGATTVAYRAIDAAGNVGGTGSVSVGADASDPTLSVAGDLVAGGVITVSGTGWPTDADGRLELHSTPIDLGAVRTDAAGAFRVTVTLPAVVPAGTHELVAMIGDARAAVSVEIRAAATPGTVPPTTDGSAKGSTGSPLAVTGGTVSIAALMLGLLALALGAVIRRRRVREN